MPRTILYALSLLLFSATATAQRLVANINQANGGSSPVNLMGNADYGAFFARPDGGAYQLFYLPTDGDSLLRFGPDLMVEPDGIIWDNRLIGDDVYFRTFEFDLSQHSIWRADLAEDSLYRVAVLGSQGSSSGINNFTPLDGTDEALFIHRNANSTFQLYRTDGTAEGTNYIADLPDNSFVNRIVTLNQHAYLVYPGDRFDGVPAFLYWYDGLDVRRVTLPFNTNLGLEVRPHAGKLLLTGYSRDSVTHVLASPDLRNFRQLFPAPNDTSTLGLRYVYGQGDQLYFTRHDKAFSHRVLRTDTSATRLDTIIDLKAGGDSTFYYNHRYDPVSGLLFYQGRSFLDGSFSLYRSDYTEAGTFLLATIKPANLDFVSTGRDIVLSAGRVYFRAVRENIGEELWVSDGTVAGTGPVADLVPGKDGARIQEISAAGNRVIFSADDPLFGREVYVSNGNDTGTRILANLNQKEDGSNPQGFFQFRDTLIFQAINGCTGLELYKSGGSAATTQLIKDLIPGRQGNTLFDALTIADKFYYVAYPLESTDGNQLIESDGTAQGTREIITNVEELGIRYSSSPGRIGTDLLVLAIPSGSEGQWLFRFNPESAQLDSLLFLSSGFNVSGKVFHALSDSVSLFLAGFPGSGRMLYRTDGTSEGTYPLTLPGGAISISNIAVVDGIAYFTVGLRDRSEYIFRTDGTQTGTRGLGPSSYRLVYDFFIYRGEPHFFADNFLNNWELYRLDPTTERISPTGQLDAVANQPRRNVVIGDSLFFTANTEGEGTELWVITGPDQKAKMVRDLRPGSLSSFPRDLTLLDNLLYFTAEGEDGVRDLYFSDGTAEGTAKVRSRSGSSTGFSASNLYVYKEMLYFSATDALVGRELFTYDPTMPTIGGDTSPDSLVVSHCPVQDSLVSSRDQDLSRAISLYPNPTADRLNVSLAMVNDQFFGLELVAEDGKVVHRRRFTGAEVNLSLRTLPSGIYALRLENLVTGRTATRKVVLRR